MAWPGALLGDHELTVALALNAALGTATVALAYAVGRRAFGATAAMLGAAMLALLPSMIFLAGVTLTETTFTFLLMLALWLIAEQRLYLFYSAEARAAFARDPEAAIEVAERNWQAVQRTLVRN